jgi:hypothetical protein
MKKIVSSIISGLLISATVASSGFAATSSFSDIENSYAKDAIVELQAKGILSGIDANTFDPKGELTRAQFVTMMVKALGLPVDENAMSSFSDVKGWAVPYIEAAIKAGIIHGIGNGKFDPSSVLTREQAAVILVLSLKTQGTLDETDATLDFKDADKISSWAQSAVALALKYGLINGNPDGTFNPNGSSNREMAAVMGANFIKSADVVKTQDPTPTLTLSSIAITTPPTKLSYLVGEPLDITGLTISGTYSDNTTKPETIALTDITGFDSSAPIAGQVLTVTVGGKTATYTVDIAAPAVISILADLTAYNVALASVSESVYTADSWTAYQAVVTVNVVTATNTQAEVDAATANIVTAQAQLVLNPVVASPELLLSNPTLTVYAPNLNQPWVYGGVTYAPNTVYQVNVNFAPGTIPGDFQSAEVSLYGVGDVLLATNKAKPALLDPASGYVGLTDLFTIGDVQDLVNDPNWEIGAYTSTEAPTPTKVVFKLLDKTGVLHIVEAPLS